MAFPTVPVNTGNTDATSDVPRDARPDILDLMQKFNQMMASYGESSGIAALGSTGDVPLSAIPVVDISRGGTNATSAGGARTNLGLGNAATKDVNIASGVANLDSNKELKQNLKGAASANNNHVWYSDGTWGAPIPSGSGWVTQAMLKTASGTVSGGNVGSFDTIALPGGKFGFTEQIKRDSGDTIVQTIISGDASTTFKARVAFQVQNSGDLGQARQEYMQSSPPYNLGDDDIPLFVFVSFRDGEVAGVYEAQDPPWAMNGPTNIHTGIRLLTDEEIADPRIRRPYIKCLREGTLEPVAEGQALKNFDMPLIPQPYDGEGLTTVLIDPVGDECLELYELHRSGHCIGSLIRKGALRVDNVPLNRCGPPGVPVVRARWR